MNDTPPPHRTDHMTLAALPTAVGCSRMFVRSVLAQWRFPRERIETSMLLTSELVTNAVQASSMVDPRLLYGDVYHGLKLIGIRLLLFPRTLVIEVWDTSPQPPTLKPPRAKDERGRGLQLVNGLSRRWNYYYPRLGGKVVWCELDLPYYSDPSSTP